MKKLRLRSWVKVTIAFVLIIAIYSVYSNKAVEQCVSAGHSQEYCEKGLK